MTIHLHHLDGCAPAPLAHYLKALGILRILAEQADETVRAGWGEQSFSLLTRLSRADLERFFLEDYQPSALVAPWNRGSGFYSDDDPAITALRASRAGRFEKVRQGIADALALTSEIGAADEQVRRIKAECKVIGADRQRLRVELQLPTTTAARLTAAQKEALRRAEAQLRQERRKHAASEEYRQRLAEADKRFKRLKAGLIPELRKRWRGSHLFWLNAALVIDGEGNARWPALLGTGGADGRLDFTNNFFQRLLDLFDPANEVGRARAETRNWLIGALWGEPIRGCLAGSAIGQYLPSGAGGANSANGPDGNSIVNPFDFVLMLEGTLLFSASAARRLGVSDQARAAAPFAVPAHGAGYASAAETDESARGEQWMPLWSAPMRLQEVQRLFSEGRVQIGAKPAREPLAVARAIARLGTARGIGAFQRFAYIERNGQANLAVPLGRFAVPAQVASELECLDDLDAWLERLRREARQPSAPARLRQAERRTADALFALSRQPSNPARWQLALLSLAEIESLLANGTAIKAGPLPRLRPGWVAAADDGSPTLRLALSMALQRGDSVGPDSRWRNTVRRHWLPLDERNPARLALTGGVGQERLRRGPEVVMMGRNGTDDAIALVARRLVEAAQHGQRHLPLMPAPDAAACDADLTALLAGEVDLDRTLALSRGLMAIDARDWSREHPRLRRPRTTAIPDDAWLVLRLALLPWPVPLAPGVQVEIRTNPAVFRRLASGDAAGAVGLALRALGAAGLRVTVRAASLSPASARRWAAALAFPITPVAAARYVRRLDPTTADLKE